MRSASRLDLSLMLFVIKVDHSQDRRSIMEVNNEKGWVAGQVIAHNDPPGKAMSGVVWHRPSTLPIGPQRSRGNGHPSWGGWPLPGHPGHLICHLHVQHQCRKTKALSHTANCLSCLMQAVHA